MKNVTVLCTGLLCMLFGFQSFSQTPYVSIRNIKTELRIDSSSVLLKVKDKSNLTEIINALNRENINNKVLPIGSDQFILIEDKKLNADNIDLSNIVFKQWVYYVGQAPYYFNGDILLRPNKGVEIERILQLVDHNLELKERLSSGTYIFKVLDGSKVLEISNKIDESGLVKWSQPDFLAQIEKSITPNDPKYTEQYYLNNTGQFGGTSGIDINAPEAWDITTGCNNIRIAVLDDGVEDHDDLDGRVLNGYTHLDSLGLGRPASVCMEVLPSDYQRVGHGMACTGIMAASHNNIGIAGIAPNSLIYPINIFHGGETIGNIVTSMNRAWDPSHGNADIISNSWGFTTTSTPTGGDALIDEITDARTLGRVRGGITYGCVVVFASGNYNPYSGCSGCFNGVAFPANVTGVVTVGAIDNTGAIHDYSSRGAEMDLVAPSGGRSSSTLSGCIIPDGNVRTIDRPGNNGYSTGDYFDGFNGTSAAAPQVSGVASLILAVNPNLTESQVRTILQQTATDMGTSGFDNTYGYGRLNAQAALIAAIGGPISGPTIVCSTGNFTLSGTPAGSVSWSSSNSSILTINSSTGAASRVGSAQGQVTITVTINAGCGNVQLTQIVWVGNPNLTKKIDGVPAGTTPVFPGNLYNLTAETQSPSTSFNYNDYTGSGDMVIDIYSPNSANTQMYVHSTSTYGSRHVRVTATNTCGSYYEDFVFYIPAFFKAVYPNPAKEYLVLEFYDLSNGVGLPDAIELINEKSIKKELVLSAEDLLKDSKNLNGNKYRLDITKFERGIWYLQATKKGHETEVIRLLFE